MENHVECSVSVSKEDFLELEKIQSIRTNSLDNLICEILSESTINTKHCDTVFLKFEVISSIGYIHSNRSQELLNEEFIDFALKNKDLEEHCYRVCGKLIPSSIISKKDIVKELKSHFSKSLNQITKDKEDKYLKFEKSRVEASFGLFESRQNHTKILKCYVDPFTCDVMQNWKKEGKKIYVVSDLLDIFLQEFFLSKSNEPITLFGKFTNDLTKIIDGFYYLDNIEKFPALLKQLEVSDKKKVCFVSNKIEEIEIAEKMGFGVPVFQNKIPKKIKNKKFNQYLEIKYFNQLC